MNNPSIEGPPKRRNNSPPKPPKAMIRLEGGRRFCPKNTALTHITLGGNNLLPEAQGRHATLKHTTTEAHQSLQTKNNDEPFAKMGGDVFPNASHIPHQIPTICNSKIHGRRFSRTLRKAPRRVHKENRPAGCAQKGTSKDANKKHLEECAQKGTSKDAQRSAANTRALALQKLHRVSTRPKQVLRDTSP